MDFLDRDPEPTGYIMRAVARSHAVDQIFHAHSSAATEQRMARGNPWIDYDLSFLELR